jgi:hypothetical protein
LKRVAADCRSFAQGFSLQLNWTNPNVLSVIPLKPGIQLHHALDSGFAE